MAVVNIPRDVKDEFYRYKMPVLVAKVEGRGNGIKTVVVNMADIAKSLARPPSYPTKFFGFELGSITTIEENDKYIVNGKHDQPRLAQVLDDFIERFVLCKKCQRNPETYMVIRGGIIELKCKACGGRSPVDMRHKLCAFVLKNPPPADKDEKRVVKKTPTRKSEAVNENGAEPSEEGNGKQEEEKPKLTTKGKKKKQEPDEEEEVVWYTDTSKEAAEQRRKNMLDNTSELAAKLLNVGLSDKPDPLTEINAFLETKPSNADIISQLKKLKGDHHLDDEQTGRITFLALFDADVFKQIKTNKMEVLKPFVSNVDAQVGALNGLTELGKEPAVLKVIPHILKYLYDEDVVEEHAVLNWHRTESQGDAVKVKDAAKVFVEWLANAEEESDEEEEDSD